MLNKREFFQRYVLNRARAVSEAGQLYIPNVIKDASLAWNLIDAACELPNVRDGDGAAQRVIPNSPTPKE